MSQYYAPKNFNWLYFFGSLSLLVLVIQIVTGIFLAMNYKPDAMPGAAGIPAAFASGEYIMRDVAGGWFIRYMHSTGASAFFVVVYLHMFRGLLYGSHRKPRELIWLFGCGIFLCLMAEAFMGYILPYGQMSYWGASVIVSLFEAIPYIGPDLALYIRGDYVVSGATLGRFFSFHVVAVPLVLIGLVVAHLLALHDVGSNNPDGVEIKAGPKGNRWSPTAPTDGIPFHPYYTVHDILAVCGFLIVFFAIVFFQPTGWGYFLESNNFIPADPMVTPAHIAPVWYFTAFYAMLRSTNDLMVNVLLVILALGTVLALIKGKSIVGKIVLVVVALVLGFLLKHWDAKFWGVVVMGAAVVTLFFLPWLDCSPVKSIRYRPGWHKWLYGVFVVAFLILMYLGIVLPGPLSPNPKLDWLTNEFISMILTLIYFAFFWLMPWWSRLGRFKEPPARITFKPH